MASGPPSDGDGPLAFSYHRALAPMMWMFLAIAIAEMLLVHGLIALWHPRLAIFLSALSLLAILWLIAFIRSLKRLPVLVAPTEIRFRAGTFRDTVVPLDRVAGLRTSWPPRFHKRRDVLNLALLGFPNVIIDLREPLPGRRACRAIAHRLDDPEGFARLIRQRLSAGERTGGPPAWFA